MITRELGGSPSAHFDAGLIKANAEQHFRISLLNQTSEEIVIDGVDASCSCTKVSEVKTSLKPGETLPFEFSQKTSGAPSRLDGGGSLVFKNGSNHAFRLSYAYRLQEFVGWPSKLLIATTEGREEVELRTGIVLSDDVAASDFKIHVSGIEGAFEYSIDKENREMIGSLALEEKDFKRLYGKLELLDLRSGEVKELPLIVESSSPLLILPTFLKFSRADRSDEYVANLFVQFKGDKGELPNGNQEKCLTSVQLGKFPLVVHVEKLRSNFFKVEIQLRESTISEWREDVSVDGDSEVPKISVDTKLASYHVSQELPFVIWER